MPHSGRRLLVQYAMVIALIAVIVVFALQFSPTIVSTMHSHCDSPVPSGAACI